MKLILLLVFCWCTSVSAQQLYWVTFTQKDTRYSIENPQSFLSQEAILRRQKFGIPITESDLPVNNDYLVELRSKGFEIIAQSKWLNGAAVLAVNPVVQLDKINGVVSVVSLGMYEPPRKGFKHKLGPNEAVKNNPSAKPFDTNLYGKSYLQVNMIRANGLHALGFKGKGVRIAVIDAGFNNADTIHLLESIRKNKQIQYTYDFVEHNSEVYEDDDHGLAVLSCMAGNIPNYYIGTSPDASYYLLRSEYAQTEMPIEEMYWIAAIECADSLGVDIVNSSLGYNEYDDKRFSYSHKDLNGFTALISRAAQMAVQKGMVVVVSAGNEGDDDWRTISVPADAIDVITVGGVDATRNWAVFSSIGPTADKRIKPDIMAMADNVWVVSSGGAVYQGDGTSYSCPIATGAIACLMQAYPMAKPAQIIAALHMCSSGYYKPDKYMGYGIPDMVLAYQLLQIDTTDNILDARLLHDNRLHIAVRLATEQKVQLVIYNEYDQLLHSEMVSVKKSGVNRFVLPKFKNIEKGKYTLQCKSLNGTLSYTFYVK